jgi:hypothetical protein
LLHNNRIESLAGLDPAIGLVVEDFVFRNQACKKIKRESDRTSRSVSKRSLLIGGGSLFRSPNFNF